MAKSLDSGFLRRLDFGFRIPKRRIPDSKLIKGRIPDYLILHGAK
jgi:hypothetical protein